MYPTAWLHLIFERKKLNMHSDIYLNFEDTEKAFAYKTDKELKKAKWLFTAMQYPFLVDIGTRFTPWAIKSGLPIKGLIKHTLFEQFSGGESLEQTAPLMNTLEKFGVKLILDYGVEGGEYTQAKYEQETDYFTKVIEYAASKSSIPFISIKLSGLIPSSVLEKLDTGEVGISVEERNEVLQEKVSLLSPNDKHCWENLIKRTNRLCTIATKASVGIMFDAEESWMQDPVDFIVEQMMKTYNTEKAIVYNTVQLYRHDRLDYLKKAIVDASTQGYITGVKLVRGAYMEKERKRALENGYPSPIQSNKSATDKDYDEAVRYCLDQLSTVSIVVASHNEESNKLAATIALQKGIESNNKHLHFSQLLGMSDNLTFNLSNSNFNVYKYLPFGPIHEVIPYLMRRAQENSSVSGQTSRELELIKKECLRRKI